MGWRGSSRDGVEGKDMKDQRKIISQNEEPIKKGSMEIYYFLSQLKIMLK